MGGRRSGRSSRLKTTGDRGGGGGGERKRHIR